MPDTGFQLEHNGAPLVVGAYARAMADRKMIKTVGEHWTCAALARYGWTPALTRDGVERTDILAVGTHLEHRPTIEVQVKTATGSGDKTSWLLGTKAQLPDRSGHEWFILVMLPRVPNQPRAFVVPRDHVAAAAWIVHMNWLTHPDVTPGTRNAPVERARVNATVFLGYEDRWDLLDRPTSEASVLLPGWLRDRCKQERVGLPPGHPWVRKLPTWPASAHRTVVSGE
jgi:hypothetical protein